MLAVRSQTCDDAPAGIVLQFSAIGVSITPGQIETHRILLRAKSSAIPFDMITTPPFAAWYAPRFGTPSMPAPLAGLIMTPPPCLSNCGSEYFQPGNTP